MKHGCTFAPILVLGSSMLSSLPAPAQHPFDSSLVSALSYRSIGPFRMQARIADIDVPSHPEKDHLYTMYVAPWVGGVFKITNNGTTWDAIFDDQSSSSIGDVTISPSNPNIVWVGTGDGFTSRSSYAGDGAYKSTGGRVSTRRSIARQTALQGMARERNHRMEDSARRLDRAASSSSSRRSATTR